MTEELLCFARGENSFNFENISLKDFFEEIEMILGVETDRLKINLKVSYDQNIDIKMDKDKVMRLIFNLTNNALEILKEGDTISILSKVLPDNTIEIRVQDSGPGIPDFLKATLFDAFVTHGKKKGTGLGLHISKEIAKGHGGGLSLDESYDKGACFVITLDPNPVLARLPESA